MWSIFLKCTCLGLIKSQGDVILLSWNSLKIQYWSNLSIDSGSLWASTCSAYDIYCILKELWMVRVPFLKKVSVSFHVRYFPKGLFRSRNFSKYAIFQVITSQECASRSARALVFPNHSARAIVFPSRSAWALVFSSRSDRALAFSSRSARAIVFPSRSSWALAFSSRSARALVFSSSSARALVFSSRSARALVFPSRSARALVFSSSSAWALVFSSRSVQPPTPS